MPRQFRWSAVQATPLLLAALAGCTSYHNTPILGTDTRPRPAAGLETSGGMKPSDSLTHATGLVAAGETEVGVTEAKVALALHHTDLNFALEVGRLAIRAGRLADALDIYQKIAEWFPNSPEAFNGQGVALAEMGNLTDAIAAFNRALALHPQDTKTRSNLALTLLLAGNGQAALPMLEDLNKTNSTPQVKAALDMARQRHPVQAGAVRDRQIPAQVQPAAMSPDPISVAAKPLPN